MPYPNDIQCALMFERGTPNLDAVMRTFMQVEAAKSGARYNPVEVKPGTFCQLFGTNELMVTVEVLAQPANMAVFAPALNSTVTRMMFPDVAEALARHRTHVLVNVRSGVMPNTPDIARLLSQIGMPEEGKSAPEFARRLATCALLARIVQDEVPASAVHWTQSDQLLRPDIFEAMAQEAAPGPLNIHPFLFGQSEGDKQLVGIRTYGAAHFIGREIRVQPSELPWVANYETILAFLKVATTENGYVIPDGDTFGPEDQSLSYRVRHLDAAGEDPALYELEPLLHRAHGFQSAGYTPRTMTFDDRSAPTALMPRAREEREELRAEWRDKRAMAEGIGGRFEVRAKIPGTGGGNGGSPPPSRPGFGRRATFGRKA